MEILDIVKKHISYTAANEVAEICKPLFDTFNINYFEYGRIYQDNSFLYLTSNRDAYYNYMSEQYPIVALKTGIHLWNKFMPEKAIKDNVIHFNLNHGMSFSAHKKGFTEFFCVASPSNNNIILDTYFNNLALLNRFLFYFKEKAAMLINNAYNHRYAIINSTRDLLSEEKSYEEFCELIKTNKFHLNLKSKEIILTRREYESLLQFTKGKTTKEVAKTLGVSSRTVESHLENAKNKTNCIFKSQLVDMLRDNLIITSLEEAES